MNSIKNFFSNRKRELIVFLLLLLVAIFSGINFGIIFGLTIFFWAASAVAEIPKGGRVLANIMRGIICVVFAGSFIFAMMPRTKNQMAIAWDKFDQVSFKTGNTTEVTAKDLWEMQRDRNGREFLQYYNELLADGETEEAYDTLQKFQKAWDMGRLKEKAEAAEQTNPACNPPANAVTQPTLPASSVGGSLVILNPRPEPYHVTVPKGQQSYCSYKIPGGCLYEVSGPGTMKYKLSYNDGELADFTDGQNHGLPKKQLATFNIINCDNSDITFDIIVTKN